MKYEPHDIVAVGIGLGLMVFILSITISAIFHTDPMPDDRVTIIKSLLDSMIAIISMYVGHKLGRINKD